MSRFDTGMDGVAVQRLAFGAGELACAVLTRGAILHEVRLAGVARNLTLSADNLAPYETGDMGYWGAIVGPVANRLSGAAAPVAGVTHRFAPNDGPNLLHGGSAGTHARHWQVTEAGADFATLALALGHLEDGFPGARRITARFEVRPPATLRLTLEGTSDRPTLFNLANHSYWNLDGTPTWAGHRLRIAAEHYLPTDPSTLPTGEVAPVAGTAFDFRTARTIEPGRPFLDHNFCLAPARRALTEVMELRGASGVRMTLATTEPGLQVYDGRAPRRPGRGRHEGLALEAQGWPDAPNRPGFPPVEAGPDRPYRQVTEWRFSAA